MRKEVLRLCDVNTPDLGQGKLSHIHLFIREGDCFVLAGDGGAGKERLMDYLEHGGKAWASGIYWMGKSVPTWKPEQYPVFCIDSNVQFLNSLDLAENFYLLRKSHSHKLLVNEKALHLQTEYILGKYGLEFNATEQTENLGETERIMIGIVRAVDQGARLLLLNEVSNRMSRTEIAGLLHLLRRVLKDGVALVINDHWPDYFRGTANYRITIDQGEIIRKEYVSNQGYAARERRATTTVKHSGDEKSGAEILHFRSDLLDLKVKEGECILLQAWDAQHREQLWNGLVPERGGSSQRYIVAGREIRNNYAALFGARIAFWEYSDVTRAILSNFLPWENITLPSLKRLSHFGFFERGSRFVREDMGFSDMGFEHKSMENLTLNERNRILLTRFRLFNPRVLFLYNVISSADGEGRMELMNGILEMNQRGTAIVFLEAATETCLPYVQRILEC